MPNDAALNKGNERLECPLHREGFLLRLVRLLSPLGNSKETCSLCEIRAIRVAPTSTHATPSITQA
jgi:hypothetical protein